MTSEQLYSRALDSIVDPVGIFSSVRDESGKIRDFVIEYLNPAGAAALNCGEAHNAAPRRNLLETDPTVHESGLFDLYSRLVETGTPVQRIFSSDHTATRPLKHLEIRATKLGDGFVSQWREVTEDVEMHRMLVESEDQLHALNESLEASSVERTAEAQARAKQLQELALALADAEARERKRLAQILHDHFQQLLSAAKLRAGMLRRAAKEHDSKLVEGAQHLERLLEEAIMASHSLTAELSPPVLYDAGLNAAIKVLVRNLEQRHALRVALSLDERAEPALEQIRVLLFEAIRELMHNVLRHANAQTATISSKLMEDGRIEIVVSDDGQGFDTSTLGVRHERKGAQPFGLIEIRERLRFIGGDVGITSQIASGTHVRLVVPAEVRPFVESVSRPEREARSVGKHSPLPKGAVARVIVADDHAIFREGLISLLAHEPSIKVVGIAADGEQTIKITRELRPDLLLLDVTMPIMNGIEVASILSREIPELRIVGLSMHKKQDMAAAMLDAGAMAYFTKGGSSEALLSMLRDLL